MKNTENNFGKKKCTACYSDIDYRAKKCPVCQQHLNIKETINWTNSTLALIVALASTATILYDKILESNIIFPPNSEISISAVYWQDDNFQSIVVNEGDRPGWLASSSATITINDKNDETTRIRYSLSPSLDIVQPSKHSLTETIHFSPTDYRSPYILERPKAPHQESSLSGIEQNMLLIPKNDSIQSRTTDVPHDIELEEYVIHPQIGTKPSLPRLQFTSYEEEQINEQKSTDSQVIIDALYTATVDPKKITNCTFSFETTDFHGNSNEITQDGERTSPINIVIPTGNDSTEITYFNMCSILSIKSLSEIDYRMYRQAITERLIRDSRSNLY